jgi:hypothetical protein
MNARNKKLKDLKRKREK